MKRDRMRLASGFLPALSMGTLLLWDYAGGGHTPQTAMLAELAAFAVPLALLLAFRAAFSEHTPLRLRPLRRQGLPLVLFTGLTVSLLSVLFNYGVVLLGGRYPSATGGLEGSGGLIFLAVALVPALTEELFFRSGLLGAQESGGTGAAIVLSALCFALVHGSLESLPATLAAGLIYGWLCYTLHSVWAAVLAHLLNNALSLLIGYGVSVSEELGVWPYFLLAALFLFFLFAALALRSLERLLERGKTPRFKPAGLLAAGETLLVSPGMWLLVLLFLLKVFYL